MKKENNIAFIDGQNLYMGIASEAWNIDYAKFRIYLKDKYKVTQAYYFIGFLNDNNQDLYDSLQEAGFIVKFREHTSLMMGKKKGNVDTDIVFEMMKRLVDHGDNFDQIVLVSGDGDYKKVVDYMISKNRFEKILFPNGKKASSLYNNIDNKYKSSMNRVRSKIEYKKK